MMSVADSVRARVYPVVMAEDRSTTETAREIRPVDLGLSEGKSMAFVPTGALQPEGPPIGGLAPASPNGAPPAGHDLPTVAAEPESPPSGSDD